MDIVTNVINTDSDRAEVTEQSADPIPTLDELALLDDIAYDQNRKVVAEKMGIRVSTLDHQVHLRRPRKQVESDDAFPPLELWSKEVDLADLLDEIVSAILRHVVLERHCAKAIALYVILTYCIEVISCCPNLGVESPEKRCGKTTLIDLLTRLVNRPTPAANISTATIYRLIEAISPTLLLDEVDTFLKAIPEMIGILNSGHQRATAFVWRTVEVGNDWEPQKFSTWAAKVIAQIGKLPDTLRDRSIIIPMRRKLTKEKVERLRKWDYSHIPQMANTWALENRHCIPEMEPAIPDSLNDREADSWEPLLAIAILAGGDWPEDARAAATKLSSNESDSNSMRIQLLTDLRLIFKKDKRNGWRTSDLLKKLCEIEDHPWLTYCKGKQINARQLAALLKPFGIKPDVQHKLGYKRGYMTDTFDDVFQRYLPPDPSVTPLDFNENSDIGEKLSVRSDYHLADEKPLKPLVHNESNGITHELPNVPEKHMNMEIDPKINQGDDSWTF